MLNKKKNILFLLFSLICINININLTQSKKITFVDPLFIQIITDSENEEIYLDFDQDIKDIENLTLVYSFTSGENITLQFSEIQGGKRIVFIFNHKDFVQKNIGYGNYYISYGANNISFEKPILIYLNEIQFVNPTSRYFLNDGDDKIQTSFGFKYNKISKDQIKYISYHDNNNKNIINYMSDTDYDVIDDIDDKGNGLNITFKRDFAVNNYTFYVYQTTDEDNFYPKIFYIYFQDFFVFNEAVYANESADSTTIFFEVKFKATLTEEDKSKFSLRFSGIERITIDSLNFTDHGNNDYYHYFKLNGKPSAGKIIIIFTKNNTNQERPIYLITYQTNNNKCYLNDTRESFIITFSKIQEMEYTHNVYFNTSGGAGLNSGNKESTNPRYTKSLNKFEPGYYHLYSKIAKLSSNANNPIDNSNLFFRVFPNPNLQDAQTDVIYTNFNGNNNITFDFSGAGYVGEIFLISPNRQPIEILGTSDFKCTKINNEYNCDFNNLDNNYIGNYTVNYTCECDQKKLTIANKIIQIERGILLVSINHKWCFIDEIDKTQVILTYSFTVTKDINISFCDQNYNNCNPRSINNSIGQTVTVDLKNLAVGKYYIQTVINGQTIKNDKIIFKVLEHLDFSFNHHYFVKDKTIKENKLLITKNFSNTEICVINCEQKLNNNITDNNCKNFSYEINTSTPLGVNTFRYLDKDIDEFIPIDKNITVVPTIDDLIDFNNMKGCYYFNFSITGFIKPIKKFNERIFLVNNNNQEEIEFEQRKQGNNNKEYTLNETNLQKIFNIIGKKLDLYISEETLDKVVYLYKTEVTFTKINVPEYLIKPNKTIYFSGLSCNICDSSFIMQVSSFHHPINANCKYSNTDNSITIDAASDFYIYNYYNYIVDNHYITANLTSINPLLTFVSNSLNESYFQITSSEENPTSDKITIVNTNKDFYFKLISSLTLFKIINGKNNTKLTLNRENSIIELKILESDFKMSFIIEKGNYDLDVNHITRKVEWWEGSQGNRIYYFFKNNNIFNYTIFRVSPTVFASHALTSKNYIISINFINHDLLNSFEQEANSICSEYNIPNNTDIINCTLKVSVSEN